FTGIVEELGRVRAVEPGPAATRLVVEAPIVSEGAAIGESIAVNGACLTVVDHGGGWWAADAVAETLGRTTLGRLRPGDAVNLERPMRPDGRLGGHLVQGHVDGVGEVLAPAPALRVRVPAHLLAYLVEKGSVTVDGCSLTVVEVGDDWFSVAIIPHTAAVTTLGTRAAGDAVNLEADVIAKYVERLLGAGTVTPYGGAR
ncbi:MAG: riboflavin synthase, partial [Acidimicrobiales bacterium]